MDDLADFIRRLQAEKPDIPASALQTRADLEEITDQVRAIYERQAERAGLDLAELVEIAVGHAAPLVRALQVRIAGGEAALPTIHSVLAEHWLEGMLAGALWEQSRQLPDIDAEAPPEADR